MCTICSSVSIVSMDGEFIDAVYLYMDVYVYGCMFVTIDGSMDACLCVSKCMYMGVSLLRLALHSCYGSNNIQEYIDIFQL